MYLFIGAVAAVIYFMAVTANLILDFSDAKVLRMFSDMDDIRDLDDPLDLVLFVMVLLLVMLLMLVLWPVCLWVAFVLYYGWYKEKKKKKGHN